MSTGMWVGNCILLECSKS